MASYRDRVGKDLERWIASGLVAPENRSAILATLPETRRLDAASALAWVGAVLLGIAVIAFIAANWDGIPRLGRFGLVLLAFAAFAGAGAWASHKARPALCNGLLTIAALIFAAAIGLTGQIFDIAGDPRAAAYASGVAAFALALAGRSTGAACVGLAFIGIGDFGEFGLFSSSESAAPALLIAAPLGAFLALRWSSAPLAHLSALTIIFCFGWFASRGDEHAGILLFLSIAMAAMAGGARWLLQQDRPFAGVFYGWFTFGALLFFAICGYLPWFGDADSDSANVAHRLIWIIASGALVALGRYDEHRAVTTIGVLSLIISICALLTDLGLDLLATAGVFLVCALIALIAGLWLKRRKADA